MTTTNALKVKSLRLAKAKMAELELLPDSPSTALVADVLSKESSSDSCSNLNYLQEEATCPGLEKAETLVLCSTPAADPFKISIKKVVSSGGEEGASLGRRSSLQTEPASFDELKKRIKHSNIASYFEDLSRFTHPEMTVFEQIYGETLFNNTISFSPLKQADVGLISTRKFKTYRQNRFGEGLSHATATFQAADAAVRAELPPRLSKAVTASMMVSFLRLLPSQKGLRTLLENDPEVVLQFFQQMTEKD